MPTTPAVNHEIDAQLRTGMEVITAEGEAIGELLRRVLHDRGSYLQVVRYGAGRDELFIPMSMVQRVVGDHIYLGVEAPDLLGKAWHELPRGATSGLPTASGPAESPRIDRILVPTDGSPLSQRAAPVAIRIARAQNARLFFAQVVLYPQWIDIGPESYLGAEAYQQWVDAVEAEAQRNLDALVAEARAQGVPAESARLRGSPAAGLLDYEESLQPDLVVMATHGRGGLARFARGSVADVLLREGTSPLLLIRSFEAYPEVLRRALVPLDGSEVAEQALPMVDALAGKPVRGLTLCQAIEDSEQRTPAFSYLEEIAQRFRQKGLEVKTRVVVDLPHSAIKAAAGKADIVIMATHGRGGLDRLRHGSTADRALADVTIPLLLVRAGAAAAAQKRRAAMDQGTA